MLAGKLLLAFFVEHGAKGGIKHQQKFDSQSSQQKQSDEKKAVLTRCISNLVDNGLHFAGPLFNKRHVPSKRLTSFFRSAAAVFLSILSWNTLAFSAENTAANNFLGMNSCSSSGCHGGAAEKKNECEIWSKKDFHSRSFATLTTARSERLAEVLKMVSPTKDASCTSCHAPFQTLPPTPQTKRLDLTEGVSCESCHGPAEAWLRSHTRSDFTHLDRVNAGMRDLKNLYSRANSCVACHQNISSNLLAAGHPELIFELDGQAVSQPKHWTESAQWNGAQTWLVGQAVALREISWQRTKTEGDLKLRDQWSGLVWLLERIGRDDKSLGLDAIFAQPENSQATRAQKLSDELARTVADTKWSREMTARLLNSLATTSGDFREKSVAQSIQARRAERLVLCLDRLVQSSEKQTRKAVNAELGQLFSLAQSLPDFDPAKFADALDKFSSKLRE